MSLCALYLTTLLKLEFHLSLFSASESGSKIRFRMERKANFEPNEKLLRAPEAAPVKTAFFHSTADGRYQQAVRLSISPLRYRQLESLLVQISVYYILVASNASFCVKTLC